MNYRRLTRTALFAAGVALSATAPALAQISLGAGGFASGGSGQSSNGGAVFLGTGASVPVIPVSVGLTGFVPLARNGGYAVTLDGRFAAAGNAFGIGYGLGQFAGSRSGGTFTAFIDHRIAPLTSLELRGYQTTGSGSATAGFLGVRFSL